MVDKQDLGSCAYACGFESHYPHEKKLQANAWSFSRFEGGSAPFIRRFRGYPLRLPAFRIC